MDSLRAGAKEVAALLKQHGFEAYFAGGCVRDLLLGLTPKDYDVVTDAIPEQVSKLFRRTVEVGAAFGVVRVLWSQNREYEVATYRTEGTYSDGRRPDVVAYSKSKEEDVHRRDFTINALLMETDADESAPGWPESAVIDEVGGRKDLKNGVIRAVGDAEERFAEDKLRMLRAVRFAARFGFEIEEQTFRAIAKHAADLKVVSVERIVTELHAIFEGPRPAQAYEQLTGLKLAPVIWPFELDAAGGEKLSRLPEAAQRQNLKGEPRSIIAWALLLHDTKEDVETLLRGYKLSRDIIRGVLALLEKRAEYDAPEKLRLADRRRLLLDPNLALHLAHLEAWRGEDALETWRAERTALESANLPAKPLIGGGDLKTLGLPPSPRFRELLHDVETEVLEARIRTREEALAWVKARLGRS